MSFPLDFTLDHDAWGQLVLTASDGRRWAGVEPVRAFPISGPEGFLSICDAEGHELACIEDPDALKPEIRQMLEDELARREFMPVVGRIVRVFDQVDPSEWHVVTDRGPTTFQMEDSDNDVRRLGPARILLVDAHGIRYLIPDVRRLDADSRRILERYL
jgi:hypothetical protein